MSLQPSPMVKAAVKERSPCEEMTVFSTPSCELDMSTYGATCPTEALAGAAETIEVAIKPAAASSTEDQAATRRGPPRSLRTLIISPSLRESRNRRPRCECPSTVTGSILFLKQLRNCPI
jgi:hypothetical protein